MCNGLRASLVLLLVMAGYGGAAAQSPSNQPKATGMETDVSKSSKPSKRCSETGRASLPRCGECKQGPGRFAQAVLPQARVQISAVRSVRIGDRQLGRPLRRRAAGADHDRRAHAVARSASDRSRRAKVDFIADESYEVTPLAQGFVDILNKVASVGYAPWALNASQSIFGKSFAPFCSEGRDELHGI